MNVVEVITYGGGSYYRDIFQAVALMAGANGLSSLIRLALVLGLIMGLFQAVFDFNVGKILRWFLVAYISYGVLWVPKVQIHVTDLYDPGLTGADVANVPLGVGMTASLTSLVGHRVIELTETAFGDPQDVAYSKTGMIFGAKVFERLRSAKISDPVFDQNMHAFVRGCVYYDILEGYYSAGELARQNDLWTYITVTKGTNPGRSIEYQNAGSREIVSCTVAAQRLDAAWSTTLTSSIKLFERKVRPELDEARLNSAFLSEMGTLHPIMLGASRNATSAFQQVLMANAIRSGVTGFSAEAGGDAVSIMAQTQAEVQTRKTQQLLGGVAEKAIVILKIVVDLLFIGMFPVLFPAMLLPKIGPKMIQGYLTGFLYLQLWGPMYVIVHKIAMGTAAAKTAAAAYIPDTVTGLKIANLESISSVNADIAGVAGVMTLMIPVLAGMLTKGAMAVGSQGEALLAQFRSGAEAAGASATTGNYSFGNTAFENQSWNNKSANRWSTSGEFDQGNFSYVDGNLNRTQIGANGTSTLTSSMSNTAFSANYSDGVSKAYVEAGNNSRSMSQSLSHSVSEGQSRVASESAEKIQSWLNSDSKTRSQGSDSRDTWGSTYQVMDQVSQSLQKTHGYDERTANQLTARAAAEWSAMGPLGPGIAKGTIGADYSATASGNETNGLNAARQALSSSGYTDRVDKTAAQYASESFSQTSTAQSMSSQKMSDTFSSTRSITDAANQAETQARSYEQRADFTRSNAASLNTNLNNQFTSFAMDRLVGQRDAYGALIDQERAAYILSGRGSSEEMAMVQDLQSQFRQEEVFKIEAPDLVQTNSQSVGQTVSSAPSEPLRVLEPSSGSDLGAGVNLRDLGRPGSGVSDAAPGTSRWEEERAQERLAQAQSDNPPGSSADQNQTPSPDAPRYLPGEPQLMPGIINAQRDQIRGDTDAAGASVDSRPAVTGSVWSASGHGIANNFTQDNRDLANTTSRLFNRYPDAKQ
jgi:conjugal transfer mating pair stabilization protein TraG